MNQVEIVKKACKERNISIHKLEMDLGFANGYISQLKKGIFPSDRAQKISNYLGIQLIGYDDETISKLTSDYAVKIEKKDKKFSQFIKDIMTQEHEGFITFAGYNQKVEQEALERFERYKSLPPETQMAIDLLLGYKKPSPAPRDSQENTDK